jgi:hypothetical protein
MEIRIGTKIRSEAGSNAVITDLIDRGLKKGRYEYITVFALFQGESKPAFVGVFTKAALAKGRMRDYKIVKF